MVKPKQVGKLGYPTGDCILQQYGGLKTENFLGKEGVGKEGGRREGEEGEGERRNSIFYLKTVLNKTA